MSRKLDVAIAIEGLEYEVNGEQVRLFDGGGYRWYPLPHYSTNAKDMLELDAEMRIRGFRAEIIHFKRSVKVGYYRLGSQMGYAVADDEITARAIAAYTTLTGKEWVE